MDIETHLRKQKKPQWQIKNVYTRYGIISIFFHWFMALLIIGMLTVGLYMASLPSSVQKSQLYGWHKEIGIVVLGLVVLRTSWRLINVAPTLLFVPAWQRIAANSGYYALYGFMFALPLTGWLMSSAAGYPVSFFGWFVLPNLVTPSPYWQKLFVTAHHWLGYGLIATLCLHITAALYYHFIIKNNILKRIMPYI